MTAGGAVTPAAPVLSGAAAAPGDPASPAAPRAAGARVLLLGIGNDLRGDDGAGPRVARALEGRLGWDVRVVHGLTPELADDLAACDLALFVDAHADPSLTRPTWIHHAAAAPGAGPADSTTVAAAPPLGHAIDVPALLALTAWLHGRAPAAATLALPARDFALGERLTPVAAEGVHAALAELAAVAGRLQPPA